MMSLRQCLSRYRRNKDGAVTTEGAFVTGIMIILLGGGVELGYAFWQWNAAQQSARVGARIAATSDPVAYDINRMTGLGSNVDTGDPMPAYRFDCRGESASCSNSTFSTTAFNKIVYGPDNDGACGPTSRERRGMCDMLSDVSNSNIQISYENSGLGKAGNPATIVPLITVKLTGLRFNFVFMDIVLPERLSTMPDIAVSVIAEDMKTGG